MRVPYLNVMTTPVLAATLAAAVLLGHAPLTRADDRPSEEDALLHVFDILTLADHDYDGHRIKAKHAVEAASHELHLDVRGDRHNRPGQRNSDDLMREADRELQDIRRVAEDRHQHAVIDDVEDAIHEVHFALHIK